MLAADEPGLAVAVVYFVLAVEDLEQGVLPWGWEELVLWRWVLCAGFACPKDLDLTSRELRPRISTLL